MKNNTPQVSDEVAAILKSAGLPIPEIVSSREILQKDHFNGSRCYLVQTVKIGNVIEEHSFFYFADGNLDEIKTIRK